MRASRPPPDKTSCGCGLVRELAEGATDAVEVGRPVELERFAADHVCSDRAEFRRAAVEAVGEVVPDDARQERG